jgi:hypothetical protein
MASNVEAIVREFVARLESEIRAQVAAEIDSAVKDAIGNVASAIAGSGGRGRGRKLVSGIRLTGKGGRRTPDEIARTTEELLAYVKANPGQRSEQIAMGMGVATSELVLPLRKLLAEKQLKAKGVARGTTYSTK